MKQFFTPSRAGCVLAALFLVAAGGAGDEQPKPQPALPIVDLTFAGGTVADYVAALRKVSGDTNIVTDPEAMPLPMPAVTLRHVSVPAALELLAGRQMDSAGFHVKLDVRHLNSYTAEERPTYQVKANTAGTEFKPPPFIKVVSVSGLLSDKLTSKKLLSAVETALDTVGGDKKPDVRFHEDTGLLIVKGNEDQINIIDQLIEQLEPQHPEESEQVTGLRRMLEECKGQAEALRAQLRQKDGEPGERRAPGK